MDNEIRNLIIDWAADCMWADIQSREDLEELTDNELLKAVNKHYVGGYNQFLEDMKD
jgi:hypothetical protein